jgi:hypothetical protein
MDKIEEKLWDRVNKYRWVLQSVPFVKMICVCNNLSFGVVDDESDIDLFVVAKKGRLFLARCFITFFLNVLGVRRTGDKVAGMFCLSFFVDDSYLGLSRLAIKNDIYLAYWISRLTPVVGRGGIDKFERKNRWILPVLGVEDFRLDEEKLKKSGVFSFLVRKGIEISFFGPIGNLAEKIARRWQMKRARIKAGNLPSRAGTVIARNMLKFHDDDRRLECRNAYFRKFGREFNEEKFVSLLK